MTWKYHKYEDEEALGVLKEITPWSEEGIVFKSM